MPNLSPVPDSVKKLAAEQSCIGENPKIRIIPYGAITIGRQGETLSDMEGMAKDVVAFTDDGSGVQNDGVMLAAMERAKSLGKIIAARLLYPRRGICQSPRPCGYLFGKRI